MASFTLVSKHAQWWNQGPVLPSPGKPTKGRRNVDRETSKRLLALPLDQRMAAIRKANSAEAILFVDELMRSRRGG